ncbi:hypothetical protein SAMN05421830_1073 [Desulfomicrobium norvegicum]|uniref:DUF2931 family protein n=1 Tax=Desulfomicrobium norvegicum (strain DSM 1741 / NCIMB 8310) TaxID=52561 RepID=A0A8G2C3I1_DESNO|nr:hypothetical protein [Desulfomicrobium norvegicum]SFL81797.1 hypothetical protein SAMN05421830_1073 [Desulfomicrobium norvegicum]
MKIPPPAKSVLIIAVLYLAAWSLTVAIKWRSEPMIESTGAWAQGEVWIEYVEFDNRWAGSSGNAGWRGTLSRGYIPPKELGAPASKGSATNSPLPVPKHAFFQWFNFSQQRYYEALIDDPFMPQRAKDFAFSLNDWRRFKFSLVYDFSVKGKVRLWLYCTDHKAPITIPEDKWTYTLLGTAQGYEIDGDPKKFTNRTKQARQECGIPMQPDPAPAATQPKRKSAYVYQPYTP